MTQALLTFDDIAEWRMRLAAIAVEEGKLAEEKSIIHGKLQAVEVIFGRVPEPAPPPMPIRESEAKRNQPVVATSKPSTRSSHVRPSFPGEVARIFEAHRGPLTFEQVKGAIEKGPLGDDFRASTKGFYHAIARLQQRGFLTKHRGWLLKKIDLEEHQKQVTAGTAKELVDVSLGPERPSAMGEAIKEFLSTKTGGVTSPEVITFLKADDRFAKSLTKNSSGGYNVIARLQQRGEIRKEGKLLYPLKENEPPEGGSETGEVTASPKSFAQEGSGDLRDLLS